MTEMERNPKGASQWNRGGEWPRFRRDHLLELAGLDVQFIAVEGDYAYWQDAFGNRRRVLDLVGSAGARLLGHNHAGMIGVALRHFHDRHPILVQGACGGRAQTLKRLLAERIGRETERDYEVHLVSNDAEAIESALMHARLEFFARQDAARRALLAKLSRWKYRLQRGNWSLDKPFLRHCESVLGVSHIEELDSLGHALLARNAPALEHTGLVLAAEGHSRGNRMDLLAGQGDPVEQLPFERAAPAVRCIRPGDGLEAIFRETAGVLYDLELDPPSLVCRPFSTIVSVILEPMGGDDGLVEVEDELVLEIQTFRTGHPEVPTIVDETRTGLGRTGRFLEGAARGLPCDYVTVGQALGGGIAKLAAVAIDRSRYVPEYSFLHASRYAEDDYSSALGAACLATVDLDHIAERCAHSGSMLRTELLGVARSWPGQIAAVRGCGLMQGVEFREQSANPSAVLRALDDQRILTIVIAGFLFHRHDLRVLPAMEQRRVLRVEPSAYLDPSEIGRISRALSEVCAILQAGDAFALLVHLVRKEPTLDPVEIIGYGQANLESAPPSNLRSRADLTDDRDEGWVSLDPSLRRVRPDELATLLN
jgi:acetylornithine/succinyldiaminopimelate/putrescine aminotransferase